jgi:hypothetical protein
MQVSLPVIGPLFQNERAVVKMSLESQETAE